MLPPSLSITEGVGSRPLRCFVVVVFGPISLKGYVIRQMQRIIRQRGTGPGRHYVGTPGATSSRNAWRLRRNPQQMTNSNSACSPIFTVDAFDGGWRITSHGSQLELPEHVR